MNQSVRQLFTTLACLCAIPVGASGAFAEAKTPDARKATIAALEVASHQQVERLVGPADLDVRLHHHRVVPLHEGIEHLVDVDRDTGLQALGEVVTLQRARHGRLRGELQLPPGQLDVPQQSPGVGRIAALRR